jgi:Carboxypeptidase regulatory-like domain/TonB dependent receptor
MGRRSWLFAFVVCCAAVLSIASLAVAQVNTGTLSGLVTDPQGLALSGTKVTATYSATGATRSTTADEGGHYLLVGLVPGEYILRVEAANFAPYENSAVVVTVGQETIVNVKLALGTQTQVVNVTTESAPVETTRSESSHTIEERQIDNLPINGRSYINFTQTNSQTTRDVSPTIGPAPNSGLNISGSRARSNMVSVDGADAGDNSVNGIRSTISQEGVQEFQLILSNYNAEYGRATGGVVNIVTKSGSNEFHGDVFGYLRNSSFQARNPFSGEVDADGNLVPVKQAYTRVQTGVTFGGALKKDKTFYFFSYEYTQREETGFSSIGQGKFGLTTGTVPCLPPVTLSMTPTQLGTYQQALGGLSQLTGGTCASVDPAIQAQITGLQKAALVTAATSNVSVNGDMNVNVDKSPVPLTTLLYGPTVAGILGGGSFFPLPIDCPLSRQVNQVVCLPNGDPVVGTGFVPLPSSYVALNSLRGNFPVMEKTSLWSARLDQHWNNHNSSFIRVGVSPSLVTGIQSTSQNQVFGQNAGSRTGLNQSRDVNVTFQHDSILSDTSLNEFRFQFARRGLHFGYSQLPGGSDIGVNIPGFAYFGREPYSPVDRIERRWQFTDAATVTHGHHTFKFGGDVNIIQLRSKKTQIFQLDFGGVANFSGLTPFKGLPGITAAQAYGIGIPGEYIQGIGSSNQPFDNLPFGFFAQDTWRINPKLTLNYGVRYDLEISPLFAPATTINANAEKALGVVEGIPRDYNNVAPRIGVAWDPWGDGKTVIRAGYGLFYDHPLLAIAFDSTTADGGRSVQLLSPPATTASACGLSPLPADAVCGPGFDSPNNLNGDSIFQGALNALPNMFYLPGQSRFDPFPTDSLFANQNYLSQGFPLPILPFTLPVAKNFVYGYAQQANLTVERVITGNWKLSVGYQWTRGLHLYRPVDVNSTDPTILTNNGNIAVATGLIQPGTDPLAVVVPSTINAACGPIPAYNVPAPNLAGNQGSIAFATPTGSPLAPSIIGLAYSQPNCQGQILGLIGTPAVFNYFRPSGPNPSYSTLVGLKAPPCASSPNPAACGFAVLQQFAAAAHYPVGFGVPVPFNSVDAQQSDARSSYNALTINLNKRFSNHFELLSSYTWSHSIDDGTDLQSTLEPQDSRFPFFERANSVNDQRHRWVTSGVFQTSPHKPGESFMNNFLSNFTFAPLVEWSSGRPFNIITGVDTRLDLGASQDRPDVGAAGALPVTSPYIKGFSFGLPTSCLQNDGSAIPTSTITPPWGCGGNLGRNRFAMSSFFQFDMRISKGINFGERLRLDLIADAFNLFNHTNILAVDQLCDTTTGAPTCTAGRPTAAYDARQFQFALKFSW